MEEPTITEEPDSTSDKELLEKAISLLKNLIRGYKVSSKCQCAACEAGKFLNEII